MDEICISIRMHFYALYICQFGVTTQGQTCEVSRNRRECHAFEYNFTLTCKEGKISTNFSNLTHLSIFSR